MATHFAPGDNNVICDRCGGKFKRSQVKKEWDGKLTCVRGCFELRNTQDFIRGIPDLFAVRDARPDVDFEPTYINLLSDANKDDIVLSVNSTSGLASGTNIGIVTDVGYIFCAGIESIPTASTIRLNRIMFDKASSGNKIYIYNP